MRHVFSKIDVCYLIYRLSDFIFNDLLEVHVEVGFQVGRAVVEFVLGQMLNSEGEVIHLDSSIFELFDIHFLTFFGDLQKDEETYDYDHVEDTNYHTQTVLGHQLAREWAHETLGAAHDYHHEIGNRL